MEHTCFSFPALKVGVRVLRMFFHFSPLVTVINSAEMSGAFSLSKISCLEIAFKKDGKTGQCSILYNLILK